MQITAGTHLGPYEILARIGAGGMGEVWRARDTRIGREVAIKVLPAELATNTERVRRFEQEARAAGALNHPNLITVHDLSVQEGAPYIVMELLEGETLRDRIGSDATPRLPVRKAIDLSIEMANGLAAAHDKQIVHRDLKPENIFVTSDGRVKLLDFGIAKLVSRPGEADTRTLGLSDTATGTILGTVAYMSPEQVLGLEVDHRTDVFAFGAILFEMLTGRQAFRRDSVVATMNAIVKEDPEEIPISGHHVPLALDRIVRRCLEKKREERFQSARDLAFALEAVSGSGTAPHVPATIEPPRRATRRLAIAVAAAVLAIAGAAVGYFAGTRMVTPPPAPRFTQLTFQTGVESDPAIAPNGETFVFIRDGDIYLQRVDGRNAINLTNTPDAVESAPSVSPDGRFIAFQSSRDGGGIFVMGATGESVRRVTSAGFDPAWSPDGRRLAYSALEPVADPRGRVTFVSPLRVVELSGGEPQPIYDRDAMQPQWSPDGSRIAFWAIDDAGRRDIYTVAADGRAETVTPVTADAALDWNPVWSPDGRWLYFSSDRSGTMGLWRVGIDQASGRIGDEPRMIPVPAAWVGRLSIDAKGRYVLFQTRQKTDALYVARVGAGGTPVVGADGPVFEGSMEIRAASASPDGQRIAFTTEDREDLFVMRADGSDIRQLTDDDDRDRGPTWTPDGQRITFYSARSGSYQIWAIRPDGSGLAQLTALPPDQPALYPLYAPDGRRLVVVNPNGSYVAGTDRVPITSVEALPAIPPANEPFNAQSWSPDGARIAGTQWSQRDVYVYSLAERTYRRVGGGSKVAFIGNGRLLVGTRDGVLRTVDLSTGATREILRERLLTNGAPASTAHLVLASRRREADIWMLTLTPR